MMRERAAATTSTVAGNPAVLIEAIEALHAQGLGARVIVTRSLSFHDPSHELTVTRARIRTIRKPAEYVRVLWERALREDARAFRASRFGEGF